MRDLLVEHDFQCPYCGEHMTTLVEFTGENQDYIEDCQVCCRPIVFMVTEELDGTRNVSVFSENDVG